MILVALLFFGFPAFTQTLSLVKDITPGTADSYPRYLTVLNNKLYFSLSTAPGKLFVSDGTEAGTTEVGPSTGNGTIWGLTSFNGELYFAYDDGIHGQEIWKSDGTAAGTVLLKDINTGSGGSIPRYFTVCNGKLFFQASTASRSQGLWVTDGTSAGTVGFDIYATPIDGSIGGGVYSFSAFNGMVYFSGNAGSGYGFWRSDGTLAGTQLVKAGSNSPNSWTVHNNKMYFGFDDNAGSNGLWQSDGTSGGTVFVKALTNPHDLFSDNNRIYFASFDNTNGDEPWISDGTSSGTTLLKDISQGTASSTIRNLFLYQGVVYFFTSSGELYKTDGTSAGTVQIKGPGKFTNYRPIEFGGKIYWFGTSGDLIGSMYESDGTVAGTKAVDPTISVYANEGIVAIYQSELYVAAYFGSQGVELCKLSSPSGTITVTTQPTSQAVCPGANAIFTTAAAGANNLTFQWQKSDGTLFNDISNTTSYSGATTASLTVNTSDNSTVGTYRCRISGDNSPDVFTNNVTLSLSNCSSNTPPSITSTPLSTVLGGKITIDLLSITTDADGNLDPSLFSIVQVPASGALAAIDANAKLTVDYSDVEFVGRDVVRIQACDVSGSCAQQDISIDVSADIQIYDAISPNSDGKNDFFFLRNIDLLENTKNNTVTIFSRWGDVVFEADDYDNKDRVFVGLTNSGKELVTGTYYYRITFKSGRASQTGFLYLKR